MLKLFLAFLLGALVEGIHNDSINIFSLEKNYAKSEFNTIKKNTAVTISLFAYNQQNGIISIARDAVESNSIKKNISNERESEYESLLLETEIGEAPPDSENFHLDKPPRIFTINSS